MRNKTKDTTRKEEFYAEASDSQRRHATLWAAWEAALCGGRTDTHGLNPVLRLTENDVV